MAQAISKMETTQTAVDWLQSEWQKKDIDISIRELFDQAKAMEKEQIIIARWIGDYSCDSIKAEQYYKETYGCKDL